MRFPLLVLVTLFVSACGNDYAALLPDGGRGQVNCLPSSHLNVSVKVLDRGGNPASGASVKISYLSTGDVEAAVTDSNGLVLVTDAHGPGQVRVQADLNDLQSQQADITFVGTDCSAYASPQSITLQLQ